MHLEHGKIPDVYTRYIGRKILMVLLSAAGLALLSVYAISAGSVQIPIKEVIITLLGKTVSSRWDIIIWNIRLPQILAAIVAGAGLAVAGVVMQSILRNPLGSPFTLGISQAAAFGAAFSVMFLHGGSVQSGVSGAVAISNQYVTTGTAFVFCILASMVILLISRVKRGSPEVMVLAGVALGSLFTAGTMFLQFFADDVQLAAIVFWTFGDVARASWKELGIMTVLISLTCIYFYYNRWNYNAIDAGDETARGLGVDVQKVRLTGMILSCVVTAAIVAFLGIIGFVGLVCPHIVRRLIGDDHRFLIPGTLLCGSILLLSADTVARIIMAPHVLPVAILTSSLGAPLFIYILVRGYRI
jgi:iron complex transport system permease protein